MIFFMTDIFFVIKKYMVENPRDPQEIPKKVLYNSFKNSKNDILLISRFNNNNIIILYDKSKIEFS